VWKFELQFSDNT
jgi:hypothetical protein